MKKINIICLLLALTLIFNCTTALAVPQYQTSDCILDVDMLTLTDLKTKVGDTNGTALATSAIAPPIIDNTDSSYIADKTIRKFITTDKNFIYTPASMRLLSTNQYSVELWMKPTASGWGGKLVSAEAESVFSGTTALGNQMFLSAANKTTDVEFTFFTKSTLGTARAKYLVNIPKTALENQWINLTLSIDGSHSYDGTMSDANSYAPIIYVNSVPYTMQIPTANTGDVPTGSLISLANYSVAFIGNKVSSVNSRVGGIRVYNKALNVDEAALLYNDDCEGYGLQKVAVTPKSSDNTLKSLSVSGYTMDPAVFSPDVLDYTITLPQDETTTPDVSNVLFEANDATATAVVQSHSSTIPGKTEILVTAENGLKKIYNIFYIYEVSYDEIFVNFGVGSNVEPVVGYVYDKGQVYGKKNDGYTYGWDTNRTAQTRTRTLPADFFLNTVMVLNYIRPGSTETWTMDLPNGLYEVTVGVGDSEPSTGSNNQHMININGFNLFNNDKTAQDEHVYNKAIVNVTNGKLTLDNSGSTTVINKLTKLNYMNIKKIDKAVNFFGSINGKLFESNTQLSTASSKTFKTDITINNITCDPLTAIGIVGVYDSINNKLLKVEISDSVDIAVNEFKHIVVNMQLPAVNENCYIRTFVWDNLVNITPIIIPNTLP